MKLAKMFRAISIAVVFGSVVGLVLFSSKLESAARQDTHSTTDTLEARSKKPFMELRGLAPCHNDERRWLVAAERKLVLAGHQLPYGLIMVAPTFAEVHLVAFDDTSLERYTFPNLSAFNPEFIYNDQVKPQIRNSFSLTKETHKRLISAFSRNSEYAIFSLKLVSDGVRYYFKKGEDICAVVVSPDRGTIGGDIAELVELVSEDQPSIAEIERTLDALEKKELRF